MKIDRFFPNLISSDIIQTKNTFCDLLGFCVEYESDWFIHLKHPALGNLEIGILPEISKIVPTKYQSKTAGLMLTYTVENVDEAYIKAKQLKIEILEPPQDLFYGQRRLLLLENYSGALIDISSECEPSKEFLATFDH